jgi:anti-anti-sigma factor
LAGEDTRGRAGALHCEQILTKPLLNARIAGRTFDLVPVLQTTVRSSQIAEGRYAVAVSGDLDLDVAPTLRSCLNDLVEAGASAIVVDLLEVSFIDSAGLGVFASTRKALEEAGGELILVVDNPNLKKLLTITGVGRDAEVETSLLEAVSRAVA